MEAYTVTGVIKYPQVNSNHEICRAQLARFLQYVSPLRRFSVGRYADVARAVFGMRRLDRRSGKVSMTRRESWDGTMEWLLRAQDATPDGGVSASYSLISGWDKSYPETTGYIMQTLLRHYRKFGDERLWQRVKRMSDWEIAVQRPDGGTPGSWQTPTERSIVFDTGQVLLGWSELLRTERCAKVQDAAVKAARWIINCMHQEGYFEKGLSEWSPHGSFSHNAMVSWGLQELAFVTGDSEFAEAALRSAAYYASTVNDRAWPTKSGFDLPDCAAPTTHTVAYTIQGILEVGILANNLELVELAHRMLHAALPLIDSSTGLLPGRIRTNWQGGASWCCLTGSSQFATCMLRLVALDSKYSHLQKWAEKLIDYIISTQLKDTRPEIDFGVRGSYPFAFSGYLRATFINWAAKFHVDSLFALNQIQPIRG